MLSQHLTRLKATRFSFSNPHNVNNISFIPLKSSFSTKKKVITTKSSSQSSSSAQQQREDDQFISQLEESKKIWDIDQGILMGKDTSIQYFKVNMLSNKVNSIDLKFLGQLDNTLTELENQFKGEKHQGVVFTAQGKTFSAGLNLPSLINYNKTEMTHFLMEFNRVNRRLATFPYPTLAAMNGHAIAGGTLFAFACDFRVAVSGFKMGVNEVPLGLSFPSSALSLLHTILIRAPAFKPCILRGDLITSDEGYKLGVIDEIIESSELESMFFLKNYFKMPTNVMKIYGDVKNGMRNASTVAIHNQGLFTPDDELFITNWFTENTQHQLQKIVETLTKPKSKGTK